MNTPRKTLESFFTATLLALAAVSAAQAQTNNYFGSNGTLNGAVWSTLPAGPYTSTLVTTGGAIINFDNPASFVGVSITVAGINATANATSSSSNGTVSNFNNGVIPVNVASGVTLDFGTQAFTTSGTAGYVKTGNGTLAFAGGSYGGGFTLNSGLVILRGTNALGSGGTLTLNGGIIAANVNRSLNGKYSSIIVGGDFQLGDFTNSLSNATATISTNATTALGNATRTITIGANATYTWSGVINGDSGTGLRVNALPGATGALILNNTQSILPTAFSSNTTVVSLASTTGVVVGQFVGGTGIAANTVVSGIGTGTVTLSQPTSASNNGTATLTFSGSFYNGGTTLNSGVLQLGSSSAFSGLGVLSSSAIGTGNLTINGGVLSTVSSNGQSIYVPLITVGGNFTVAQASGGTGRVSLAGTINLAGGNRTITLGRANLNYGSGNETLRFEGVPAFAAANIIQNGALTVTTLTGNATNPSIIRTGSGATVNFSGNVPLILDDGVAYSSGTGSMFGTGTNAPALTVNAPVTRGGGVLQMGDGGGTSATVRNAEVYSLAGGGTVSSSNTSGNATTGTLTINNGNGADFAGVISEAGGTGRIAVTKSGNGTQTLSGNNSYSGLTTVSAGTLKLGHPRAHGNTLGNTTVSSGAALDLAGQTLANEAVILNGSGISSTGALVTSSGNASLSGPVILGGDSTIGVVNTGNTTTTLTLSGGITESVAGKQLTKVGEGTLVLSGNSTFTGPLKVSAGTVQVAGPAALPAGAALNSGGSTGDSTVLNLASANPDYVMSALSVGGIMRISAPASGTATLTFAGSAAQGFTGSAASKKLTAGDNVNVIVNGSAFELLGNVSLDRSHTLQVDGNGTLTFNTPLIATGSAFTASVTKLGTGLLTLSANNSYTGNTTVSAGTLALRGSQASAISLAAGTVLDLDLASPVASTASLSFSGNATVRVVGTPVSATTYNLFTGSAISGTPALSAPIIGFSLVNTGTVLQLVPAAAGDTTKPIITLNGNATVTVNAGTSYTDAGATATDETDPANPVVTTTGTVNTAVPGIYVLSYDAVDTAGNTAITVTRTVTVVDATAPVITRTGPASVSVDWGSTYTDAGATATDNVDPSVTVTTTGTVNTAKPGTYTLTYNATDAALNAATPVTRTVTVSIANSTTVGADGLSPLMRYALGATSPGGTVEAPATSATSTTLSLTAVVRTDDAKLAVVCKTNTDLTASGSWTTSGVSVAAAASQAGVPSGCVRNVYTVTTASRTFLRLEATLAP